MAKKTTSGSGKPKGSSAARKPDIRVMPLHNKPHHEDELNKAFDPMKDMHVWTMWRSAVTGKIVDETKAFEESDFRQHPYGKSIIQVPLKRLIRLDANSWEVAQGFMNPFRSDSDNSTAHKRSRDPSSSQGSTSRKGTLGTGQFVFYGVPRAVLKK